MLNFIKNYTRYRKTYSELMSLSDRELTDLGISRYDIPSLAKKHIYG